MTFDATNQGSRDRELSVSELRRRVLLDRAAALIAQAERLAREESPRPRSNGHEGDLTSYPLVRFLGTSNNIGHERGVSLAFGIGDGEKLSVRLLAGDMRLLAAQAMVVCMGLDQDSFEAVASGIYPLIRSQSSKSLGRSSSAGLPQDGQSVSPSTRPSSAD